MSSTAQREGTRGVRAPARTGLILLDWSRKPLDYNNTRSGIGNDCPHVTRIGLTGVLAGWHDTTQRATPFGGLRPSSRPRDSRLTERRCWSASDVRALGTQPQSRCWPGNSSLPEHLIPPPA